MLASSARKRKPPRNVQPAADPEDFSKATLWQFDVPVAVNSAAESSRQFVNLADLGGTRPASRARGANAGSRSPSR